MKHRVRQSMLSPDIGRVAKVKSLFMALKERDRRSILRSWHLKIKNRDMKAVLTISEEGKLFCLLALNHRHGADLLDGVERWIREIRKGEGL